MTTRYYSGGEITHEDSMGNCGVIKAGDVQRMCPLEQA